MKSSFSIERFGNYVLTDQIAAGGMAVIYKALALMTDGHYEYFAIKRILPQYTKDKEFISLLQDEAKLMVKLNHPNIVSMVEFGKINEQCFIAMEYVEGTTLKGLMKKTWQRHGVFTIDLATHMIREVANGLAYAHRRIDKNGKSLDLVHRDVSPANILLSYYGDIKLADFGISKAQTQNHRTQVGIIRGKIGYMSPEQTRSDVLIDQRSDIYSLGIIFYEMLTAHRLFSASAIPEAIKLVRDGKVPLPSSFRADIPPALEKIVMKMLAYDRDKRYQSALHIVDDLNEYLVKQPPKGRPTRVSHVDVMGFVKRFHEQEIQKIESERETLRQQHEEFLKDGASEPIKMHYEESQTYAVNPMYELSRGETTAGKIDMPARVKKKKEPYEDTDTKESAWKDFQKKVKVNTVTANLTMTIHKFWHHPKHWVVLLPGVILLLFATYMLVGNQSATSVNPTEINGGMQVIKDPTRIMRIESEPSEAKVWINDELEEHTTPLQTQINLSEPVRIKVQKDGYGPVIKTVSEENFRRTLRLFLEENKQVIRSSQVHLRSDPSGARIYLDDVILSDQTPVTLSLELGKTYKLKFEKKGYKTNETSIDVGNQAQIDKKIFLSPVAAPKSATQASPKTTVKTPKRTKKTTKAIGQGVLSVISKPWSYVYVDGKRVGETPLIGFSLNAGTYTLLLRNDSMKLKPYKTKISISGKKTTKCIYTFESKDIECSAQ